MNLLKWVLNKTLLNWEHPVYSPALFKFCTRYLDLWYGDNNFDRTTNGEYRLLQFLIPKASIVFDVGANVGDYSGEILKIKPSVTIHAFEPDVHAFAELQKLNVVANNCALGDKEEKRLLYRGDEKTTHNSFYNVHAKSIAPVEVPTTTLDAYCKAKTISHIDFLKIDVEGFEFSVLRGAENMIRRGAIEYIQFEFSGATIESRVFLKDFLELFNRHEYDLHRIKATSVEKIEYLPSCERFTLTNYLAVKKGLPVA
jgi:FkbM family methyltransferase